MTVQIILEPYTYSTKIVRRRLSPVLFYRVTFALRSCEMYLHEWRSLQSESTGIQHVSCATNTITTRSPCESPPMKLIRACYTNFLNMFKNFVLATCTRRTLFEWIVIVIVIARMTTNDQELSLETNSNGRFVLVRGQIRDKGIIKVIWSNAYMQIIVFNNFWY